MNQAVKIKGSSFVVTGGAGFVGSHVVETLLERGAKKVTVLDQCEAIPNLESIKNDERFEFVRGEINDRGLIEKIMKEADGVFHLATLPLGPCTENPELAVQINILGAFTIFNEAAKAGVKKVVYSSASSVYGDTLEVMDESHPFNAKTHYGISKLCGEYLLQALQEHLDYVVLRYMNVYGPKQAGGLIPSVLNKICAGERPQINGDGSASFDFVHVADVAACNLLAMESDVTAEAFNVGSGEEFSVKQIVEMLIQFTGSKIEPQFNTEIKVPMFRRVGSSEKAKKFLNYQPSLTLADGLKQLADMKTAVRDYSITD